jgi:hypothetical protein
MDRNYQVSFMRAMSVIAAFSVFEAYVEDFTKGIIKLNDLLECSCPPLPATTEREHREWSAHAVQWRLHGLRDLRRFDACSQCRARSRMFRNDLASRRGHQPLNVDPARCRSVRR